MVKAIELIGGECILVGINPHLSVQIIQSGVDLKHIHTFATLEQGIEYAIEALGYRIEKQP